MNRLEVSAYGTNFKALQWNILNLKNWVLGIYHYFSHNLRQSYLDAFKYKLSTQLELGQSGAPNSIYQDNKPENSNAQLRAA